MVLTGSKLLLGAGAEGTQNEGQKLRTLLSLSTSSGFVGQLPLGLANSG